jgi:hypothetical protein
MAEHSCTSCLSAAQLPKTVRPIKWVSPGGRVKLCATCLKARQARVKALRRASLVKNNYGVPVEDQAALWEYQNFRCPCGRKPTRNPDADHDHKLAEQHDHPDDESCSECFRGFTDRQCNQVVLGRYNSAQLRALADYLDDPPYPRMLRERRERNG